MRGSVHSCVCVCVSVCGFEVPADGSQYFLLSWLSWQSSDSPLYRCHTKYCSQSWLQNPWLPSPEPSTAVHYSACVKSTDLEKRGNLAGDPGEGSWDPEEHSYNIRPGKHDYPSIHFPNCLSCVYCRVVGMLESVPVSWGVGNMQERMTIYIIILIYCIKLTYRLYTVFITVLTYFHKTIHDMEWCDICDDTKQHW